MKDIIQIRKEGLYFVPGDFYLDPKIGVKNAVISHAHADHANPNNFNVWCTPSTRGIMQLRYRDKLRTAFSTHSYRETFKVGDVQLQFIPAGHILGSAQVIIDFDSKRYCYTGDFKMRPDASCEKFEAVACDVLITESTFAEPGHVHPPEKDEMEKLDQYKHMNLVIGAYNLGKAQSLTKLLHEYFPGRRVMVHPEASCFHRYYEQNGISLGPWQPYNYQLFRRTTGNILIAPPRVMSTYTRHAGIATAFATGWKKAPITAHFNFHLSDHADWNEIIELITLTGAKKVLTVHGNGLSLMKHYQDSGCEVSDVIS